MVKKQRVYSILFCGVGGQGVLKASEVCGWAALMGGFHVKKSEVHGMAQRGGSVESHLRFGDRVLSPLIPKGKVDFLVAFHKDELKRLKSFMKKGGVDFSFALDKAETELSDRRFLNTYMIGVLSLHLPIREKHWLRALNIVFGDRFFSKNKEIFLKARKYFSGYQGGEQ